MKLRIAAIALLVATGAFAQTPVPAPPTPEQAAPAPLPPQKFYLELDPNDLQVVSQALNELPKRIADPLIQRLNAQLQAAEQARISSKAAAK